MEEFIIHLAKSSLFLLLAYCVYLCIVRLTTFHHLNRGFLLSTVLISIIMPFFHFPVEESHIVYAYTLPTIDISNTPIQVVNEPAYQFVDWLGLLYVLVSVIFTIRLIYYLFSLADMLYKHPKQKLDGFTLLYSNATDSAFSFFRYIVLPANLIKIDEEIIIEHEKQHAKKWHSVDILLMELAKIFFWFHPVIYLLKQELIQQHEFEIDRLLTSPTTLKSDNTDKINIIEYGNLLIQQAQQIPIQLSLANNFNHSLIKNRIQMMTKQKSKKIQLLRYVILIPLLGIIGTLMAFEKQQIQPVLAEVLKFDVENKNYKLTKSANDQIERELIKPKEIPTKIGKSKRLVKPSVFKPKAKTIKQTRQSKLDTSNNEIFTIVQKMPKFPGGDVALLQHFGSSIIYPAEARLHDIEGVVVIGFTVEKDGSITDLEILRDIGGGCGDEAMRIAKEMPTWTPGMQDGKLVRVAFKLPVRFRIQSQDENSIKPIVNIKSNSPPTIAEKMPTFPGGDEALLNFYGSNIVYPEAAKTKKVEGIVILEFIVEKDGSITNLKILKDIGEGCGEEAARVATLMPNWLPGTDEGQPLKVSYKLPVRFQLDSEQPTTPEEDK